MLCPASPSALEIRLSTFGMFRFAIASLTAPFRGMAASGKLTDPSTFPSSRNPRSRSAATIAQFSRASRVDAPRWGSWIARLSPRNAGEGKSVT